MPDRFAQVAVNKLYRGGKPTHQELSMLKDLFGIKKIVSLDGQSGNDISDECEKLGLKQEILDLGDGNDPKVEILKKEIVPNLLNGGPTYVHCYHGKDRTGMCIAMFRILHGMTLADALTEAYNFGMGKGLSNQVRQSYYDAVRKFSREIGVDNNTADDAVSLTRETNQFAPMNPAQNNMTVPFNINDFSWGVPEDSNAISPAHKLASMKFWCKCKHSDLLKPKTFWWNSKDLALKTPMTNDGHLYSADIPSFARIENIGKKFNQNILQNVLLSSRNDDIDVLSFSGGLFVVLYPNVLENIIEDDDINDLCEAVPVGMRDNSTNYLFTHPGSGSGGSMSLMSDTMGVGGMPAGGAGFVELPYTGGGQL
jgi:hypothetical protein